ncbi:MAG: hypothetical protein ACXWL2_02705 [Candidatus Chromulinivorax sp.]
MKLIKICSLLVASTAITNINYASAKTVLEEISKSTESAPTKSERRKSFDPVEDYNAGSRITFGFSQQAIQQDAFNRYGQTHQHYGEEREVRIRNAHNYKKFVENISTLENATTLFEKILPNQPELNFTEKELANAKKIYTDHHKNELENKQNALATIIAKHLNETVPARNQADQIIYTSRVTEDRLRAHTRNQEDLALIATIQTLTEESKTSKRKIVANNPSEKGKLPLIIKTEEATNLTLKSLDKALQKYQQQSKK